MLDFYTKKYENVFSEPRVTLNTKPVTIKYRFVIHLVNKKHTFSVCTLQESKAARCISSCILIFCTRYENSIAICLLVRLHGFWLSHDLWDLLCLLLLVGNWKENIKTVHSRILLEVKLQYRGNLRRDNMEIYYKSVN